MSKRNSREEKSRRREELARKRAKFDNPCPKPNDYVKHFGFIPNEPFFQNAAIAWDTSEMRLVLRTKEQLVEYANSLESNEWVNTTSGDDCAYVSVFHTGDKQSIMINKNITMYDNEYDYSTQRYFYIFRHIEDIGAAIGKTQRDKKYDLEYKRKNPFYYTFNTFYMTKEDIKTLPSFRTDKDTITKLSKKDESYTPLREDELDRLLAGTKESYLRENYVFEEGGLVIDEFEVREGQTLYQPRKKEETWKKCSVSVPFYLEKEQIVVARFDTKKDY